MQARKAGAAGWLPGLTAHEGQADHSQRLNGGPGNTPLCGKSKAQSKPPGTGLFRHHSPEWAFHLKFELAGGWYRPDQPIPWLCRRKRFWQTWWAHPSTQPGRVPSTPLKTPMSSGAAPGPHYLQATPRDSMYPGTAGEAPRPWRWNEKPQGRGHSSVTRPSEKRASCANKAGLPARRVTQG